MKTRLLVLSGALIVSALIAAGCGSPVPQPTEPAQATEIPQGSDAAPTDVMSEAQAREIAANSPCGQAGALKDSAIYNENTFTWWIDMDIAKEGCAPACVVDVRTGQAEINWRCTGLIAPEATEPAPEVRPTLPAVADAVAVAYGGVSFAYGQSLVANVSGETIPAIAPSQDTPEWEITVEHIVFSFEGYALPNTFHKPRIYVFPANEFEASSAIAARVIAALRQVLAERPASPGLFSILPPFPAGQLVTAQVAYVDFQNGTGVRFLTQLGQAYAPINNTDLFYTFQGLTSDGRYYVAAILPASHPWLPADGTQIPNGDLDTFAATFEAYAANVRAQLDAQPAASFAPDLALLDALIASLEVNQGLSSAQ